MPKRKSYHKKEKLNTNPTKIVKKEHASDDEFDFSAHEQINIKKEKKDDDFFPIVSSSEESEESDYAASDLSTPSSGESSSDESAVPTPKRTIKIKPGSLNTKSTLTLKKYNSKKVKREIKKETTEESFIALSPSVELLQSENALLPYIQRLKYKTKLIKKFIPAQTMATVLKKTTLAKKDFNNYKKKLEQIGYKSEEADYLLTRKSSINSIDVIIENSEAAFKLLKKESTFTDDMIRSLLLYIVSPIPENADGGANLIAFIKYYEYFKLDFQVLDFVYIVARVGGAINVCTIKELRKELNDCGFGQNAIILMGARQGGGETLRAAVEYCKKFKAHGLTSAYIARMALSRPVLEWLNKNIGQLIKNGHEAEGIIKLISH